MSGRRVRAVIPMKPLARSKLRLAPALEPRRRASLSLWMLERVALAVSGSRRVAELAIVGGDEPVQALCRRLGLSWHADGAADLNAALNAFYSACGRLGWDALLFLAGDLPQVCSGDVDALVTALEGADLVLAPGARGGTNAAALRCGLAFEFQLGGESLRRHEAQAAQLGLVRRSLALERIEADVDTPEDLDRLQRLQPDVWQRAAPSSPGNRGS